MNAIERLIPVAVVALIPAAVFVHRRLSGLAQPLRLELAEKGERLLASKGLPKEIRAQVNFMLDTAFGMGWLMALALVIFPPIALFVVLFRRDILARSLRDLSPLTSDQKSQFYEVMKLHDRITTANHPILQMLLELELIVAAVGLLIVIAIAKLPLPATLDKAVVLSAIEMRESKFFLHRGRQYAH